MGIWLEVGTLMARPLSSTTKTTARRWVAAKLRASWKSPSLVAPSPMVTTVTASSPRILEASAIPAAWMNWVATTDPVVMIWSLRQPKWAGIWRPPVLGSSALARAARSWSRGVIPSTRVRARSR